MSAFIIHPSPFAQVCGPVICVNLRHLRSRTWLYRPFRLHFCIAKLISPSYNPCWCLPVPSFLSVTNDFMVSNECEGHAGSPSEVYYA